MSPFWSVVARAAALGFGLSLAGCGSRERPPEDLGRPLLEVEYAGCATVFAGDGDRAAGREGPICTFEPEYELSLWVRPPAGTELEIAVDGVPLTEPGVAVADGWRFRIAVPAGATRLSVHAGKPREVAAWSLTLRDHTVVDWLAEAIELATTGRRLDARQILESRMPAAAPIDRAPALSLMVRIAFGEGDATEAARLLEQSIAAHRAVGRVLDQVRDATIVVFGEIRNHRFAEARSRLDALTPPAGSPAETVAWIAYYRGLLAGTVGDYRTAITELRSAVAQAERVDLPRELRDAQQVLAGYLQVLGRSREAAGIYARLQQETRRQETRERGQLLNNQAWSLLLAREAGEPAEDPTELLLEAQAVFEQDGRPDQRLNVAINLALAHLQNGRLDDGRTALAGARELHGQATTLQRLWWLEIEARIALAGGHGEAALALYRQLEGLAEEADRPEGRWRAEVGQARAHAALGSSAAALAALETAESLLDEESLQVPLHEGRETFVAQRETGTRFYLELLLGAGRASDAIGVARRSRARVLRTLRRGHRLAELGADERDAWYRAIGDYLRLRAELEDSTPEAMLPADQLARQSRRQADRAAKLTGALDRAFAVLGTEGAGLAEAFPPSRPGELTLVYHPLPHGWVGFASAGNETLSHRFDLPAGDLTDPERLSARLLEPFRAAIDGAERLRFLPYGPLREIDLHALPYGGDILLAARPVVYGLDVSVSESPDPGLPFTALIVADPQGDLPAARFEAREVGQALASAPGAWQIETLRGAEASIEAVRAAIHTADLLHYSGHGVFAGRGGWESALRLAGGGRLTPGDLLTLGSSPRWVVLSGCETARSAEAAPVESIGLAHACLLAGSSQVVAAMRPIDDRDAARLFSDLYRSWDTPPDLVLLLRRAVLDWRRTHPEGDWASFRVLEP